MTTFLCCILGALAFVWMCDGVCMLLSQIQDIKNNRKREARDLEYHRARMKDLK